MNLLDCRSYNRQWIPLNSVIDLESVRDSLKWGVVILIYKESGKDPLLVESYRDVTLSSVVTKVLEFLVLERLQMVFLEASIPHLIQSAYRKRVWKCMIGRYLRGGSQVFMCLYNLQKVFDLVMLQRWV